MPINSYISNKNRRQKLVIGKINGVDFLQPFVGAGADEGDRNFLGKVRKLWWCEIKKKKLLNLNG